MKEEPISESLIACRLGQYKINDLYRETRKTWLFRAEDLNLERIVALKVLKPKFRKERGDQFLEEGKRLARLDEDDSNPNIVTVYSAGEDNSLLYLAMRFIDGRNLKEIIDTGERFSLERIIKILGDISNALEYSHEKGIEHKDLKLKNIQENPRGKCYVLDFGSKVTRDESSNDLVALGKIAKQLLERRNGKAKTASKRLEGIADNAISGAYISPKDIKEAIEKYKMGITRRKFLGIFGSFIGLSTTGLLGYNWIDYQNSIDCVVNRIKNIDADDNRIEDLFLELANRIADKEVRWLAKEKITLGKFPYATTANGNWINIEAGRWTDGFWPGILWRSYEVTKDENFMEMALEWTQYIKFNEADRESISPVRFYHSFALGYDLTRRKDLLGAPLEASKLLLERFNDLGNCIPMVNKNESNIQRISLDSLGTIIPLICWSDKITNNPKIEDIIRKHCETCLRFINLDGSGIQEVEFDPRNMKIIRGIVSNGYNELSCQSRSQARSTMGFIEAYKTTREGKFLEAAEGCAKYFICNLPEDKIPFYDFKDSSKKIPKDSSAAVIASSALLDLAMITSNLEYKRDSYKILKSIIVNCLSVERHYEGLLKHACADKNNGYHVDNSLVYGDYYFMESLSKIKKLS